MPTATLHAIERADRFVLRQRYRPLLNQYEFRLPAAGEEPERPVCFVEQKRFTFKEDIRFYADDSRTEELMRIRARRRFDPRARYDVTDADGAKIGEIQKEFGASLLRSSYVLFDAQGDEVARASERSRAVALVRRVCALLPDIADWLPIPYHFDIKRGDALLGTHTRRAFTFRDIYAIDLGGDPERTLDRRLVLAVAVGMDALQSR